jgi:pyruvate dehydrogenase E2 component (dihydrolipoamide acetyltransferase)
LTDLLLRAQGKALKNFPAANSVWMDDNVISLPTIDVGLVVALPGGIIIPILRSPEKGNLETLVQQRCTLVEAARSGKLAFEALQSGATSLSNLGTSKVDEFAAVIAPRQSSILAVGRASPRPFVLDGKLAVRTTLRLCLSVDHRVLDGAPAADFLGSITQLLEQPEKLI